ncbi:MAG: S8 family serine peptidase, partial [Ruminiclostridium sp.]|nr:S8 family serine peptidase [Ruminiclostridium sp.]
ATQMEPNYRAELAADESGNSAGWAYDALKTARAAGYGLDGTGVRIAIIDSGIDLKNANLQNAAILTGYDYAANTTAMKDDRYHGTYVAQTIAGDSNGLACTGVACKAELVPLRCFSASGGGTIGVLCRAIYDAVDVYHCQIINMSWALKSDSDKLREAIQYAADKGVILVAASGNATSPSDLQTKFYPAAYDKVISVGSIDANRVISPSSVRNNKVTLCAPGVSLPFVNAAGKETTASGTSFSAPLVAAEIALLLQLAPQLDLDALLSLFQERAMDLGSQGYDNTYGYGFLPLDAALGTGWTHFSSTEAGLVLDAWILTGDQAVELVRYSANGVYTGTPLLTLTDGPRSLHTTFPSPTGGEKTAAILGNRNTIDPAAPTAACKAHSLQKTFLGTSELTQGYCATCGYRELVSPRSDHPCPSGSFLDMPALGHWAHEGIDYCVARGLMQGVSADLFCPNSSITRGQLVTILYRMAGSPSVSSRSGYSDVPAGQYYSNPVAWASARGIVTGLPDGTFQPDAPITREQLATILWRYAGSPAASGSLFHYPDSASVGDYARSALIWATQVGLIQGTQNGVKTYLEPQQQASRAQFAVIAQRLETQVLPSGR